MSALEVQPVLGPTSPRRRPAAPAARPVRRGNLQLVGPGFVPVAPGPTPARPPARAARPWTAAARQPLRLTLLGRRVVAGVVLLAATAVSVGLGAWAGTAARHSAAADTAAVTVAEGDTLWAVASAAALPGDDVREVVGRIAELNGLSSPQLRAGQQLIVPAG
ncbi:LysM peptidoglycan-binding domain-containing protein [Georgenia sp. SYP-B2076]|uniref:LysM peptidoglycan-binding domain-containing protein n=1 Tax=Georgenia sp. SYP-B2076 TaxID=2495881 RepID=UPI000F8F1439|nr:LysM peptidoglycan-binding domain-containing protein [Georgenia sp. SYP-B2076]